MNCVKSWLVVYTQRCPWSKKKLSSGLQSCPLHVFCAVVESGSSNKPIWFNYEIWTLYLSLASVGHVPAPVVAPADAVKEDVNELLSHVGWCLWGGSQDSLHVLICLQCGGCDVLPDCRESLAARQEGTNSVQGVPAAVLLSRQQSKGSALHASVCSHVTAPLCLCLFVSDACLLVYSCICQQEARVYNM